jgi:acyl-CoA thioesterase-1
MSPTAWFRRYRASPRYASARRLVNAAAPAIVALALSAATPLNAAGGATASDLLRLLAFGDSLTAGYGLPKAQSFTAQLERALADEGLAVTVIDAGVSGDTSAGGRARLDWTLAGTADGGPDAVIVELGANDALRGIDPRITYDNLDAILSELKRRKLPVLLAGMRAPPNMGAEYTEAFDGIYPRLAEKHGVALYPFFLEGVAADPALNQADGIHPNARGVAVIVKRMSPAVKVLLKNLQ